MRTISTCPRCRTRREEWLESMGGHRHAYRAEEDRCPGCEQLEYAEERLDRAKAGKGVQVRLVRSGR